MTRIGVRSGRGDAFVAAVFPDPELRAWALRVLSVGLRRPGQTARGGLLTGPLAVEAPDPKHFRTIPPSDRSGDCRAAVLRVLVVWIVEHSQDSVAVVGPVYRSSVVEDFSCPSTRCTMLAGTPSSILVTSSVAISSNSSV
jgi:hypothetical protein